MTERFSVPEFELALPAAAGQALWQPLGLVGGEHCYVVPVKPGVLIFVRSSVKADGWAAETAQDSIRCWLASDDKGTPLGSKDQRWIARTSGWRKRLLDTLRALWRLGKQLTPCSCGAQMLALKVKKEGENRGKWFAKCPQCQKFGGWLKSA